MSFKGVAIQGECHKGWFDFGTRRMEYAEDMAFRFSTLLKWKKNKIFRSGKIGGKLPNPLQENLTHPYKATQP